MQLRKRDASCRQNQICINKTSLKINFLLLLFNITFLCVKNMLVLRNSYMCNLWNCSLTVSCAPDFMFCKEIVLGPGWWPTGTERLCAEGAASWKGVGTRGSLVSECLQQGTRPENFQNQQICSLKSQKVALEPMNKHIYS